MLSLKLVMTQSEPATTMVTMSTPNASASTLFVLSGSGGDVQKEHKVDTHLRDGEHREAERDAGRPEQRSVGDPEGDGREDYGSSSKHDHVRIRGRETAIAVVFMASCSGL